MSDYQSLGMRKIINANATLTRLGGSLMAPEVLTAMLAAADCFVDLPELQCKVGDRIAQLTRNDGAYISSGAAAGLVLATASCITGSNPDLIHSFPNLHGLKNEVIVHRSHRNGYDYAVRQTGVRIIEIGSESGTSANDLIASITPYTAAIFWFQGAMTTDRDLPLAQVVEIGHQRGIPVVVDAAAQLPPVTNLWHFTQELGADLAIFSGGKDLRGPQSSGLVLGRKDLIEACRMHGNPNAAIGRPMKVGKEEMLGLLVAVERYLKLDHDAREATCESIVTYWCAELKSFATVEARRDFPNEAGQPLPRCKVTLVSSLASKRDAIIEAMLAGEPAISVAPCADNAIFLNPMTLETGEEHIVIERLKATLARLDS